MKCLREERVEGIEKAEKCGRLQNKGIGQKHCDDYLCALLGR